MYAVMKTASNELVGPFNKPRERRITGSKEVHVPGRLRGGSAHTVALPALIRRALTGGGERLPQPREQGVR